MPLVTFITRDGKNIDVDAITGQSLMEAATDADIDGIDADCGGGCSCATCHVHVHKDWLEVVGAPNDLEAEMLEFEDSSNERSRLSCQIEMTDEMAGLVLQVADD